MDRTIRLLALAGLVIALIAQVPIPGPSAGGGGGGIAACAGDINAGCTQVTNGSHITNASIPNTGLANSSMTLAGHSVALGGTQAIACGDLSNGAASCSTNTTNAANISSGVLAGARGGGLVLLEQHTASSSATLDLTTAFTSTYDDYQLDIVSLIPATNTVTLQMLVSTDAGSTWKATLYQWTRYGAANNGAGAGGSGSDTSITLGDTGSGAQSNTTTGTYVGTFRLQNLLSTAQNFSFTGSASIWCSDSQLRIYMLAGAYNAIAAGVNAVRFQYSSGNIASGTIRVYGISR